MRKSFIILTFLLAVGCKEISFREPQPLRRRALTAIPKKLQGKYLTYMEDGQLSQDTVVITRRGYRFGYFEKPEISDETDNYDSGSLSDSLVLKSYKGYYFLNIFEKPEWLLRVIKQDSKGDLVYMAMEEEDVDFNDYMKKLSAEIRIDSVLTGDKTLYHINPTPGELIHLIERGFFSKTRLKKIR
jgi:hypothetical protein